MIKRLSLSIFILLFLNAPLIWAQQPMRIGTNVWPGYEPLYLASSLSDWNQQEQIRLVEYPSASEVIRAFRNKAIEAATLTLDEVLALRQSRLPIRIILVMDVSDGGDVILGQPEISNFNQLKGKRVAVETGALGAYMIIRALEIHNMSLNDIEIDHLDVSSHEAAFSNGQVDAVVTFEPVRTRLISLGAKELFNSRKLPGEIVDVLVVHQAILDDRPELIRQLLEGWFNALDFLRTQPQQAAQIMSKRLGLSADEVLQSYHGLILPTLKQNRAMLEGDTPSLGDTINKLERVMKQNRLLPVWVEVDNLINGRYLPAQK